MFLVLFQGPLELKKRLEEVRLLESRKSARLMDQDTDFARLADMAGDRKRPSSHSIDVPTVQGWVPNIKGVDVQYVEKCTLSVRYEPCTPNLPMVNSSCLKPFAYFVGVPNNIA